MIDPTVLVGAGVVSGVALTLVVRGVLGLARGRGGAFAGQWEQLAHDARGGVRAHDMVTSRRSGSQVSGTIRRREPMIENYKSWRFQGRVTNGLLSAIYWSDDPGRTPQVHGSLYLAPDAEGRLVGTLSTRQLTQHGDGFLDSALETRLIWRRPGAGEVTPAAKELAG